MRILRVIIGCECSGAIRREFRKLGHDAWSCDFKEPEDGSEFHVQGNVLDAIGGGNWDIGIFHPTCKYLSSSGLHWNGRTPGRAKRTWEAIQFAEALWDCPIKKVAIENPVGCLSTFSKLMKPTQIIQPHDYGENASKATCLWLRGLPPLIPTQYVEPRMVNGKPRWANQTDGGQNKLGPSEHRETERSRTYPGVARAMATQWSNPEENYRPPSQKIINQDKMQLSLFKESA